MPGGPGGPGTGVDRRLSIAWCSCGIAYSEERRSLFR